MPALVRIASAPLELRNARVAVEATPLWLPNHVAIAHSVFSLGQLQLRGDERHCRLHITSAS